MASWLQAQLKVAENLLEAVDKTVSSTAWSAESQRDDLQDTSSSAPGSSSKTSVGTAYGVNSGAIPFAQTTDLTATSSLGPSKVNLNGTTDSNVPTPAVNHFVPSSPQQNLASAAAATHFPETRSGSFPPTASSSQAGTPKLHPASQTGSPRPLAYGSGPTHTFNTSQPAVQLHGTPPGASSPLSRPPGHAHAATAGTPSQSPSVTAALRPEQGSPLAASASRYGRANAGSALVLEPQHPAAAPVSATGPLGPLPAVAAGATHHNTPPQPLTAAAVVTAPSGVVHDERAGSHAPSLSAAAATSVTAPAAPASPAAVIDQPLQQPAAAAAVSADPPWPDPEQTPAAVPGAPGKEAQLSRLVDTLRKRLDAYKAENQQLEDLLHAAEQQATEQLRKADQLAQELAQTQQDQEAIVSSAAASATAQDVQITRLQQELESSKQQVVVLQASLDTLQAQHQEVMTSKDSIEGGALEALRAELASTEARLEAERRAHQATKAASSSRERDLEEQLHEGSGALATMQHALEEAVARVRDAEQQAAVLAAENGQLKQQVAASSSSSSSLVSHQEQLLQEASARAALEARLARAQEELEASTSAARAAEAQVAALQQEVQQLHVSYHAAAGATRGPPELEQQVTELRELLYQKQAQLERLGADRAAQALMLERQVTSLREDLGRAQQAVAAAQVAASASGGRLAHDIIPMDALGEPYQRLARHNKLGGVVQASANFLDKTAASATQLLRQQPLARLVVFLYVILIHLYVYFLLARMQRQALALLAKAEQGAGAQAARLPGL